MGLLGLIGTRGGISWSPTAAELDAYLVKRSVRFNTDDSAHLSKTLSSAGNRRTWTMSFWTKLTGGGTYDVNPVFAGGFSGSGGTQNGFDIKFNADQELIVSDQINNAYTWNLATEAVFRDYSSWYHVVVAHDTTQATAADRVKIYVNGEQVTSFTSSNSTYPSLNSQSNANKALPQRLGASDGGGSVYLPSSAYLADVHFVDGLQLDHMSFGEEDATTGQWIPKKYTHSTSDWHTVNDGTTWSDGTVTESEGSGWWQTSVPAKGFDGDITTDMKTQNGSTITFTPASGIPYTSSVEIYQDRVQAGATINGNAVTTPGTANAWNTLTTGSGTLNSLTVTGLTNISTVIAAIRIDGVILTDDAGDNSFHLAMDPAESGTTYSNDLTTSTGSFYSSTYGATNAFDGSNTTFAQADTGSATDWVGVTSGLGFSGTSTVEFHCWADKIDINGSTVATSVGGDKTVSYTVTDFDSFKIYGHSNGSYAGLYYVKVDGKILVDHTAIGHDSSGQKNDWHENNLAVSGGVNNGTTWSDYFTTGATHRVPWNSYTYGPDKLFDGGTGFSNSMATTDISNDGTYLEFDFTGLPGGGIPFNTIEYYYTANGYNNMILTFNNVSQAYPSSFSWAFVYKADGTTLMDPGLLTNIKLDKNGDTGSSYLSAIKIDGEIMQDGLNNSHIIDLLADTPGAPYDNSLNGGGNYCTMNPLKSGLTLSNGNLNTTNSQSSSWDSAMSTMAMMPGEKYYCEVYIIKAANSSDHVGLGVAKANAMGLLDTHLGLNSDGWYWQNNIGNQLGHNNSWSNYGHTYYDGDVLGMAVDLSAGTLKFYKNGTDLGTAFSNLPTDTALNFACSLYNAGEVSWNFGQRPFAYTNAGVDRPAADFLSLNTYNLTEPDIVDPNTAFYTKLYTGNGHLSPPSQTITGIPYEPGLLWIKNKGWTQQHALYDSVRGVNKGLDSSDSTVEDSYAIMTHFTDDGFTVVEKKTSPTATWTNNGGNSFVAWTWNAGSSDASDNSTGSRTSSVKANPSAGFSIVSFNSGSAGQQTIGHGLNSSPNLILCKNRDSTNNWSVYHSDLGADSLLMLNKDFNNDTSYPNVWGTSEPTNDVFGFLSGTNANADDNCIAYCWSEVESYSKFGSYSGNDDNTGPFVYCGFRPALIIIKCSSHDEEWMMYDTTRDTTNLVYNNLYPNLTNSENTVSGDNEIDILSNGFKLRNDDGGTNNAQDYVFAAWAEAPFRYANAR